MIKNVVILTLSSKFDSYCVAAYDVAEKKLLRLVKDVTIENGIPKEYVWDIDLLDEVNVKIVENAPQEHQTENVIIDLNYGFKKTGRRANIKKIYNLLPKYQKIFGDINYKLQDIETINHSLEIIQFENMIVKTKSFNGKNKTKVSFSFSLKPHLDYSVTDARYFEEEALISSGYSIISLPATDDFAEQFGYFKYVSAIYPD